MHLAFLTSEYPHPRVNRAAGIGTSINNLALGLIAKHVKVTVFIYDQKDNDVFEENGIRFHLIKHVKYTYFGWLLYRKHIASYINRIIIKEGINCVEAPDWAGITAFMKLKAPLIIRLHGSDAYFCKLEGRSQKKKNYWFEANALKNADAIISVSDFTAGITKEIFGLKKSIKTLYNGIDVEKFKPLKLPEDSNSILYFGTIVRKKGVINLAKAFQLLKEERPETKLVLIGKDNIDVFEKRSTLELMYQCLDDSIKSSVTHLEHMPYEDVVRYIARAQVVVLPSHAEAFPMSWLEAMAMEKALVTSNIGWANELMINHQTGLMVDPTDHQILAKAISEILNNSDNAAIYGKNARKRIVDHFSSDRIVEKNIEFYNSFTK